MTLWQRTRINLETYPFAALSIVLLLLLAITSLVMCILTYIHVHKDKDVENELIDDDGGELLDGSGMSMEW
jgi:hypothetical protein